MQYLQNQALRLGSFLLLFALHLGTQAQSSSDINTYIEQIMQRHGIPGAAVAVIQKDKVVHQNYYGLANIEHNVPVKAHSSFRLHSLSKIFVTTGLFKLIEQDKIQLADPIGQYFPDLPTSWQAVEVRHLLTHSSGLPDIAFVDANTEPEAKALVFAQEILFAPGERFQYNQSNYWLINRLIEQLSGTSFTDFIGTHQFAGIDPQMIFTPKAAAVIPNWATEYESRPGGKLERGNFNVPAYLLGAAGISLTLDQFIDWSLALRQDEFISRKTKDLMWSDFEMTDDEARPYGWAKYMLHDRSSFGFSGGGRVAYRYFPDSDLSVIILTNGYTSSLSIDQMINYTAGLIELALKDSQVLAVESLWQDFLQNTPVEAVKNCRKTAKDNPEFELERTINSIGYYLAGKEAFAQAIEVFKLNTELHPQVWNVWDSLGEGYQMSGNDSLAIIYYQKSLIINPQNNHAVEQIAKIQGED